MDEHEIDHEVSIARRHDRWSVLVIGLSAVTQVATTVANMFDQYTVITVQHANQAIYDRKFKQMTDPITQWEKE
ncbi:MAG TPA: hypothetical protein VIY48_18385 [Candidatus Paceibacterota bacterium]